MSGKRFASAVITSTPLSPDSTLPLELGVAEALVFLRCLGQGQDGFGGHRILRGRCSQRSVGASSARYGKFVHCGHR